MSNSEAIVAFPGAVQSERKQQFLDTVAQEFDRFVAARGYEPDGIAYGFASSRGGSYAGWHVDHDFDSPTMIIARVAAGLLASLRDDD